MTSTSAVNAHTSMLNLNVGLLGHVDSGKTSLAKALSQIASTAAFDKSPQSQERGISIDLGFSALVVDSPEHVQSQRKNLQFTFVDCPGHASLIRTIIGGAQIVHAIILVVDVTKGIQTQTAECLVIGEITCKKMVVVLNKIDLLPSEKKRVLIQKMVKKIQATLLTTIFKNCDIIPVAASPRVSETVFEVQRPEGIEDLICSLKKLSFTPESCLERPVVFAIDHCFGIRGQGSIMTGTVLQGKISTNDILELPSLGVTRKVKSMQMFRRPVESAQEGDRVGICVTQLDSKQLERGIACKPGYISHLLAVIVQVQRIKYFNGHIKTKDKFHISIGHETVMATLTIFKHCNSENINKGFSLNFEYEAESELIGDNSDRFVLLKFEHPVLAAPNSLIIGSRLDMDLNGRACRLAFWGKIVYEILDKNYEKSFLPNLKIFKFKSRKGLVERIQNIDHIIIRNLIKKEANAQLFVGMKVHLSSGEEGVIEAPFGKSGKLSVYIPGGLREETSARLQNNSCKMEPIEVNLRFKRFLHDSVKKMTQT